MRRGSRSLIHNDTFRALVLLVVLLSIYFFPVLWGNKTLVTSVRDVSSIMPTGAYASPGNSSLVERFYRTPDPGAPGWQAEPWFKIISRQYYQEGHLPLWDPYEAYGTPLAAAMQPVPYYPPDILFSASPGLTSRDLFVLSRLLTAGFFMFLFARFFLAQVPSLAAAVAFMFSGYFILYLNADHLGVDVLVPAVLWVFELMFREKTMRSAALAALIILLVHVGGMPESTFLILLFGCFYFLFRILWERFGWRTLVLDLRNLISAHLLGFALSAFLLVPFAEFMANSHDIHQLGNVGGAKSGLIADSGFATSLSYLSPLALGQGRHNYFGLVAFILAFLAAALYFRFGKRSRSPLNALTVFFTLSVSFLLMKRFGFFLVNWVGGLPLASMVLFTKYQEPLLSCSMAMLAGVGFSAVMDRKVTRKWLLLACVAAAIIYIGLAWPWFRIADSLGRHVFYVCLGEGLLAILLCAGVFVFVKPGDKYRLRTGLILLVLLCAELYFIFIFPCFYSINTLPSKSVSPYTGAPYIAFLQERTGKDFSRIFSRESVLYPNWAGVFGLYDARSLNAMYLRRYREFIRLFLLDPVEKDKLHGDLADRFTGGDKKYAFETPVEKKFLQFSSIRYLVSLSEYGPASRIIDEMVRQHQHESLWGFGATAFTLGERTKSVLFMHPPIRRISYRVRVPELRPIFEFSVGIKTEAQDRSDGVVFTLEVKKGSSFEKLFSRYVNPRRVQADRQWVDGRVDLTRFRGKETALFFSTGTGPQGNNAFDWAGWSNLRFTGNAPSALGKGQIKKIYDKEVNIYEVPDVLPRAALFDGVELLKDDAAVLARLRDPQQDPWQTVLVASDQLSQEEISGLQEVSPQGPKRAGEAKIVFYDSQRVKIEAEPDRNSVLVLNDANYPGWNAYLDGKKSPVFYANYLFRGVRIGPGKHVIEFRYEPRSFRAGLAISLLALGVVIWLMLNHPLFIHGAGILRPGKRKKR